MKAHFFLSVAVLAAAFTITGVSSQTNANPTIPQHLLPCYRQEEIYHRENRLSSRFRTFIDLIRRIENSPSGMQMGARTLSMALLYHLRLDGIQPTPSIRQTEDLTPFAPGGNNYYKHRLTLVGLLPKSNRPTNYDFFNESLSQMEMCNLHFMLSYSIDPYKRDDEDCSKIKYDDNMRQGDFYGTSNYDGDSYGRRYDDNPYERPYDNHHYERRYDNRNRHQSYRHRREVPSGRDRNEDGFYRRMQHIENEIRELRKSLRHSHRQDRRVRRSHTDKEENLRNPDIEVIPVNMLEALSNLHNKSKKAIRKEEFTLGHQEMLGPGGDHMLRGGYGRAMPSRTNEGNLYKRTVPSYDMTYESRVLLPGQQMSDCPVENGVIQQRYGSVTIGSVIAGIAAGFNHQMLLPSELNADVNRPLAHERINNIWASTLAGNAADLILSLGLIPNIREAVGLRGGWNSSIEPKWYLLEKDNPNYLTDVELRGALDGLWLGLTVKKFAKNIALMPLSEILESYYSDEGLVVDPGVRASRRGDEVTSYAPTEEFIKQLHLFTSVMKNQRINTVTFSDFTKAATDTVRAINGYIPQVTSRPRIDNSDIMPRTKLDYHINLHLVIDPDWGLFSLYYTIVDLINEEMGATPAQSVLTIYCPYQPGNVYTIVDLPHFEAIFPMIYSNCSGTGRVIDYKYLYESSLSHFSNVLEEENADHRMNTSSFMSIFMLSDSQKSPISESVQDDLKRIKGYIPDIDILVITNGPKEKFKDMVTSQSDVFSLRRVTEDQENNMNEIIERIAKTPRRLSNPACGSRLGNSTFFEDDAVATDNVRIGRTALYKLDPFYFYDAKDVKFDLRTKGGHIVTVCYGRDEAQLRRASQKNLDPRDTYPDSGYPRDDDGFPSSDSTKCKVGVNVVFDYDNLCDDSDCNPLYFSVQSPLERKVEVRCVNCRYKTSVEYDIRISGLTCSGAQMFLISSSVFLISLLGSLFVKRLF